MIRLTPEDVYANIRYFVFNFGKKWKFLCLENSDFRYLEIVQFFFFFWYLFSFIHK